MFCVHHLQYFSFIVVQPYSISQYSVYVQYVCVLNRAEFFLIVLIWKRDNNNNA